jgi:endoglucanase
MAKRLLAVTGGVIFVMTLLLANTVRADDGKVSPSNSGDQETSNSELDSASALNRRLGCGVNIIGYDPIWNSFEQRRFKSKHFRLLKEGGFDSVRINLHPFRHMDADDKNALPTSWFETLDWAVDSALANDLAVILDLHEFNAMGEDPEGNHDKFLTFWRQVAPRFQDASRNVVFELLNEPSRKLTPELWNIFYREALTIIRRTNPTRAVIVGPPSWNSVKHLDGLELPEEDRNLIVTVHYYAPMEFTHQGAPWSIHRDKNGVQWLGTAEEMAAIAADFDAAQKWSVQNNRPVFLGEFGAYDKAPTDSRVRYTAAVARTAEKLGWSWAYWQFDSDFILYDIDNGRWVQPIHDALIPRKP